MPYTIFSTKPSRLVCPRIPAGRRPKAFQWAKILLMAGAIFTAPLSGAAAEDSAVAVGHALVQEQCSRCHSTGKTGDSPLPAAPKMRDLHLRYDVEMLDEALVEGILTAHPDMPQFEFDPLQASAIIAYLKSLEP